MTDYSQSGEQQLILEHFGDRVGRFLDIGAADGIHFSNTRALAEKGWGGILVEPSPREFLKLLETYRNDPKFTLVNAAVGYRGLYKFMHARDSVVSTLDMDFYQDWKDSGRYEEFWLAPVEVVNLPDLTGVTFVTVDAEGKSDHIIDDLLFFSGDLKGVELICYEAGKDQADTAESLKKAGFTFWKATANNHLWRRV